MVGAGGGLGLNVVHSVAILAQRHPAQRPQFLVVVHKCISGTEMQAPQTPPGVYQQALNEAAREIRTLQRENELLRRISELERRRSRSPVRITIQTCNITTCNISRSSSEWRAVQRSCDRDHVWFMTQFWKMVDCDHFWFMTQFWKMVVESLGFFVRLMHVSSTILILEFRSARQLLHEKIFVQCSL